MQKLTYFFWLCSGADMALLKKCPTESSKYTGIGATIFFTGLFAAASGAYALFTVFDSLWASIAFGMLWGLLIFNLDRFIVSSMRKTGKQASEWLLASPRIVLAVLISIVIAKPLEMKIFDKEIQPELIVMEQEAYARQENQLKSRFIPFADSLKSSIAMLKSEINERAAKRDALIRIAQEEADGTGGSKKKNLGPIYKIKKADADSAAKEYAEVAAQNGLQLQKLERALAMTDSTALAELALLEKTKRNGPAARMEALSRLTEQSSAIYWAHVFILLLFIAIETAPVFVKLISSSGPYDHLLHQEEHRYAAAAIEEVAKVSSETRTRTADLQPHEHGFAERKLNELLP
ncbi:MAG: DUF4407 domain-containing protein [Cyclobacteriaceae bacterium]|nr:DUF4407 domain-containing protein [Cyclobacteriaceae bacterium]